MSSGNLQGFDATNVEPNTGFDAIPAGEYDVCIIESGFEDTKSGTGKMLKLTLQVLSGPYQNRKLWDRLNLVNPNEQAVQIAKGTLSAICRAVGVMTPNDSSELHNKPMRIKVKVESYNGNDQNRITSYMARHASSKGTTQPLATAASNEGTPW